MRHTVFVKPKTPGTDPEPIRSRMAESNRFRYAIIERDDVIEVGVNARSEAEAREKVERFLGDDVWPHFHITNAQP